MISLTQPARVVIDPTAVPQTVAARRWVWPLLIVMASVAFSGIAFAVRWNAAPTVISELTAAGELARITEQELADKIQTASRVMLVGAAAKGIFLIPILVLLGTAALKFSGWLVGRPIKFVSALSALSVALLPIAVFHIAFGIVALMSAQLPTSAALSLIPSHLGQAFHGLSPELSRLASVADVFNLWAAVLLGLGIAEGAKVRAWQGVLWGLVLYLAYAGVFLIGLPALGGAGR